MNQTSIDVAAARPADTATRQSVFKVALASLMGTFIEFYDYFAYGAAAALVFPKLFFSGMPPVTASIVSFATLGVAFVTRPFGAIIFGHFGDTVGRKAMLLASVTIMGLSTFLIGLLPTYAMIGAGAPVLLVMIRLVQGIAVGGEWGGATTMIIEYAPANKRGFYGSFVQLGNVIGVLVSTGAFALASSMPEASFFSWGWRVPFLGSIVLMAVGIFIRLRIEEPPAFLRMKAQRKQSSLPIREVFRRYPKEVFIAMGLRVSENVLGYLVISYVLQYCTTRLGMPRNTILLGVMLAAAIGIVSFPLWGLLSDHIGRRAVFLMGAFGACVFAYPFFWLLDTANVPAIYLALVVSYSGLVGAMYGIQPAYISELFSTDVRYTGVSLGAQLTGIVGGLTPAIATSLVAGASGATWPISIFIIVASVITAICAILAGETRRRDLNSPETWSR
jgi:MHS family shikimate/dehydroshikimate transporter-like MFS transporter